MGRLPDAIVLAYHGLPALAVAMDVGLGYWIYRTHWSERGARWFVLSLALGGAASFLFFVQLLGPTLAFRRTVGPATAFLALVSYATFTVFAGKYTDTDFHRHPVIAGGLAAMLGGYVVLFVTAPLHGLWVSNVRLVTEPIRYMAFDIEAGLGLVYLVAYAVSTYTLYRLLVYLLSTSARATRQVGLLICGSASIMLVTAAGLVGWFPAAELNHAVYGTIPFLLFTTLALFRYDLLQVRPVARNAVVETLRDPVVVLDADRSLVDYNAAAADLWPDVPDSVGEPFDRVVPQLAEAIAFDDGVSSRIALTVDGRDRHFSVNVSTVTRDESGDADWYSILLRDVTQLERSRWQLQAQNDRLDQVAGTISHDLRNPITVADGYTAMLSELIDEDGLDADDAERALEYLDETRRTHDRMEGIIDDVLAIAREGKTVTETTAVELEAVARDAWSNVETDDASLTVTGDREFQADRSKLLTIFENCFRNAVEHGSTSPPSTSSREDAVEHGGPGVTVEVGGTSTGFYVQDDGPGIPDKDVGQIFEYGYTTDDAGTGLGLSIVRTMAESHGWTVSHDADFTGGTRFVFEQVGVTPSASLDGRDGPAAEQRGDTPTVPPNSEG